MAEIELGGGQAPFGTSAYLAAMHDTAPPAVVAAAVAKLLSVLGETDPGLSSELAQKPVTHAVLADLIMWNSRLEQNGHQDRYAKSARLFWAAQALAITVMASSALDRTASYSPGIVRAMERGGEGIFQVGEAQFRPLADLARDIVNWLAERKPRAVALIESPLGNSLPVQLLGDLLARFEIPTSTVVWNAPRNDRPSRGRTVEEAADVCALATAGCDYVVFTDEALSGTRFIKLFDALVKRIGQDRLVAVGMLFEDRSRGRFESSESRNRLINRLDEQADRVGYAPPFVSFPLQPQFKVDGGPEVYWQSPVIWGDSDLIAGKRKVNIVFTLLDHCANLFNDLASTDSKFRPYLEIAWQRDTSGQVFQFAQGLMQSIFVDIVARLPLDEFRDRLWENAKQAFPQDYTGELETMDSDAVAYRYRWLREQFIAEASLRIGDQHAWAAWNAFDATFAASLRDHRPIPRRDVDAAPFTLPYNNVLCALNRKLRTLLMKMALGES